MRTVRHCSIASCEKPHYCRGWCVAHYQRWRKHGDPETFVRAFDDRARNRTCSIPGCAKRHAGRGYCQMHLQRVRKHGDPTARGKRRPNPTRSPEAVLAAIVSRCVRAENGCLLYQGALSHGYGRITWRGRSWSVPRFIALYHAGDFESDLVSRHTCDTPACCEPTHLILGTQAENMRDAAERGRARGRFSK